MKTRTVILPFAFPRLSDAGAAQLVTALQTLVANVEDHYAGQVQQYHRREQDRRYRNAPRRPPDDPPF